MALIAVHARHGALKDRLREILERRHGVATTPSWDGVLRLVRERPVSVVLSDVGALGEAGCERKLREFRRLFPRVGLLGLATRMNNDPASFFRLGRAEVSGLVLLPVDHLSTRIPRAVARARRTGATAVVMRALSPYLPRRELTAVRIGMDEVHRRLTAEEFAAEMELSRPFLSECLKRWSLPSAGHLLVWCRLLHAGRWLTEPGRSGESVARQLEYNDGSAFRRALRNYVEATPTEVVEKGGLSFVLDRFMDRCGFREPDAGVRVSVA